MDFQNADTGFALLGHRSYRTLDGGTTWVSQTFPIGNCEVDGCIFNDFNKVYDNNIFNNKDDGIGMYPGKHNYIYKNSIHHPGPPYWSGSGRAGYRKKVDRTANIKGVCQLPHPVGR